MCIINKPEPVETLHSAAAIWIFHGNGGYLFLLYVSENLINMYLQGPSIHNPYLVGESLQGIGLFFVHWLASHFTFHNPVWRVITNRQAMPNSYDFGPDLLVLELTCSCKSLTIQFYINIRERVLQIQST